MNLDDLERLVKERDKALAAYLAVPIGSSEQIQALVKAGDDLEDAALAKLPALIAVARAKSIERHAQEMLEWSFRDAQPGAPLTRQQRAWLDEARRVHLASAAALARLEGEA